MFGYANFPEASWLRLFRVRDKAGDRIWNIYLIKKYGSVLL